MRRLAPVVVACVLAMLVAACGGTTRTSPPPSETKSAGVTELTDIGQLRAAFNAHRGVPRLIVLASPT
jgi:hypothetical protein